jgi:NADH:ubiquinone oxidoreductase subunit 6 (subunit J)
MATGNIKWLFLATVLCVFAIIVMVTGLYRNNRIINKRTDIPEEEAAYKQQGKRIFTIHAAIAAALIAVAAIVAFTLGRSF